MNIIEDFWDQRTKVADIEIQFTKLLEKKIFFEA